VRERERERERGRESSPDIFVSPRDFSIAERETCERERERDRDRQFPGYLLFSQ